MVAFKLSISVSELALRMKERLRSTAAATVPRVTWQRPDGQRLIVELTSLQVKAVDGWLLCNLSVQTDQTGKETLQFVYFLGRPLEADGVHASATINAATTDAAQVAAVWGADLQRILWDAVLDGLEAAVWQVGNQKPGQKLTIQGFHSTGDLLHTEVLAGEL